MKILIIGSHLYYNLEWFVDYAFKKLKHETFFFGYREYLKYPTITRLLVTRSNMLRSIMHIISIDKINEKLIRYALNIMPDIIFVCKGEFINPKILDNISKEVSAKTVLWFPDDPRFFDTIVKNIVYAFDLAICSSPKMIDKYKEVGANYAIYLPFACEPDIHKPMQLTDNEEEKYRSDICFVGTYYPRRGKVIKQLMENGYNVKVYGPYWKNADPIYGIDMVKAFNASKIVLNIHIESDLEHKPNMRTFEVTGSSSFLLTDYAYGLEKQFVIDKELVVYNDIKELLELAKYHLSNDEERNKIRINGHERAYRDHKYEDRLKTILACLRL